MGKHVSPRTQREEILDAAMACFTELGYEGTSIDAIAARSGLPKSAISQHFAGKAEIRNALLTMWSERLSGWMLSA
ncbi:MAG: helix-turn-helix domain-containing protein [Dehalococcoidia bacterium]|nr:helix-turn-helix domain-containing protein [Dehalococcoidia bacterium]